MKYVKQFGIILFLSLLGELCHALLPLPIPASIYGIMLLFLCLELKVIPRILSERGQWVPDRGYADYVYPCGGGPDGFLAGHKGRLGFLYGNHGAFHLCGYGRVWQGGTVCYETV